MATAKHLGAYDSQELGKFLQTQSGMNLVVYGSNALATQSTLISKADLVAQQQAGTMQGSSLSLGGEEWDHTVIELGKDKDIAKAQTDIIMEFVAKPDYEFTKNQGGGRFQTKRIKGDRQALFDLHQEESGDNHLHIASFRWAIDGNSVCPQDSLKDKYVRQAWITIINEKLKEADLPLISGFNTAITTTNTKSSTLTQQQTAQVLNNQSTIEEVVENHIAPINKDTLADTLDKEEKELAILMEQAKVKKDNIQKLQQAKNVIDEYPLLKAEVVNLKAVIDSNIIAITDLNEKLTTISNNFDSLQKGYDELATSNMSLQESLAEEQEQRKNAEQEIELKDEELLKATNDIEDLSRKNKDLVSVNNGLKSDLSQEQAIREQLEEQNQSLLADLNKVKAELEQAKNSNIELKESNADLKNANADLKAELQNVRAEEKAKYEAIIKAEVAKAVAEESKRNATMWAEKEGKYKKQIKSQQKTIDKQKEHLSTFDTLLNTVNGFFDDLTNSVSNLFKKVDGKDKLTEPEKKEIKSTVDNVNKQAKITKEQIIEKMAKSRAELQELIKEESKQNKPK